MAALSLTQIMVLGVFGLGIVTMVFMIFVTFKRLVKHLKANHPQIWKSLERPNSLAVPRASKWAIVSYVVSFRYREANDPVLKTLGSYVFMFAFVIVADIYMILFVLVHGLFR